VHGKRLEIFKEAVPSLRRLAVFRKTRLREGYKRKCDKGYADLGGDTSNPSGKLF